MLILRWRWKCKRSRIVKEICKKNRLENLYNQIPRRHRHNRERSNGNVSGTQQEIILIPLEQWGKKAQTIRISIDTLEFIKITSPKNNIKIGKGNILKRRYFQYLSMRKYSSTRKTAQFLKCVIHILEKTFYKREFQMTTIYIKICQASLIREVQIKATMGYYCTPTSLTKVIQWW